MITISRSPLKWSLSINWATSLVCILAIWLGGSLMLDWVIMPVLYTSGMMQSPDFATMGYSLFWVWNRVELCLAAFIFTGALVWQRSHPTEQTATCLASVLFNVALITTYGLSPQMSALGLSLDLNGHSDVPALMNALHLGYWGLELTKVIAAGFLIQRFYRHGSDPA